MEEWPAGVPRSGQRLFARASRSVWCFDPVRQRASITSSCPVREDAPRCTRMRRSTAPTYWRRRLVTQPLPGRGFPTLILRDGRVMEPVTVGRGAPFLLGGIKHVHLRVYLTKT